MVSVIVWFLIISLSQGTNFLLLGNSTVAMTRHITNLLQSCTYEGFELLVWAPLVLRMTCQDLTNCLEEGLEEEIEKVKIGNSGNMLFLF